MQSNKNIDYDFNREAWCLFGLPFDKHSIASVCEIFDNFISNNQKAVLSTPNMNWINTSLQDKEFKKSIINSEINVIDSAYLHWIAYFLGFPFKRKVPGSSLMQYIISEKRDKEYKLFWFGGDHNTAEKASSVINSKKSAIKSGGYYNPGFGSLDEISTKEIIKKINNKHPNFLLLALGARKGNAWIEKNKQKLNTNIISHVGATINFIAGTVKRAPVWMQKIGLEWFWRFIQEPKLWKRYSSDTKVLIKLLINNVIPQKMFLIKNKKYSLIKKELTISIKEDENLIKIRIKGICNNLNSQKIRKCFKESAKKGKDITIDFSETKYVDNSFLGILLILLKYQWINNKKLFITKLNADLRKIFELNLLKDVFKVK